MTLFEFLNLFNVFTCDRLLSFHADNAHNFKIQSHYAQYTSALRGLVLASAGVHENPAEDSIITDSMWKFAVVLKEVLEPKNVIGRNVD